MSGTLYHRKWRARNRLKIRAYNLRYNKAWRKRHGYAANERYNKKYPEKIRARRILHDAIRYGKVKKQPCLRCGSLRVHAHHPNYKFPLRVIWLCPVHHSAVHKLSPKKILRAQRPSVKVKPMKQLATVRVRLYPSTHRRLKVRAAKEGVTLADLIQSLALGLVESKGLPDKK